MPDGPQQDLSDSDEIDGPSVTAVADEPAVIREKAPEINPGDLLANRYQVEAILGKGGSGVVLRAFDRSAQALIAVKLLRPTLTHDPRWERRFSRELRLGRPIRHPNVCRVFDIAEADGYRFLTMELATGGTLRELVKRNQPLRPIDERLADAAGTIGGLAAIHEAGIVHRDVKTDNILRMEDGRLVLSDFGLATDLPTATMVSVFVGTPHYMAPEVREGEPATTRSDVWSLGVVLHEIFFARRPERRTSRSGTSASSVRSLPPTASTIERAMLALCERCLAEDPADRPANAGAVSALYEKALVAPRSLTRPTTRKRSPVLVFVVALAVIAVAITGMFRAKSTRPTSKVPGHLVPIPTGELPDWTQRAVVVASLPARVHCFSMLNEKTARLIWGAPRRAEDVDLDSGARQPARLAPETYRVGCPQLSPDGTSVLFSGHTAEGATEIRLSKLADGTESRSVTPGSEPLWLGNGREFVYDIDSSHAAVFSLSTMTFALLPDSGVGEHQMIAAKTVGLQPHLIGLLLVNENAQWIAAVHQGVAFERRRTIVTSPARAIQFDGKMDDLLVQESHPAATSKLISVDWRTGASRWIGHYPGLDIVEARTSRTGLIALARHVSSDAWLYDGEQKRRLTTDGLSFTAAISPDNDVLLSKQASDGTFSIWRQKSNGDLRKVSRGPNDTSPGFSTDGKSWAYVDYLNKNLVVCRSDDDQCDVLYRDEMLPTWPTFSPDGQRLAYVTQVGTPRLMVIALDSRRAETIGPMHWQCPPVWSSTDAIWSYEGAGDEYHWLERTASTGQVTGRRIDVDANRARSGECWPDVRDPASPFYRRVRTETEEVSRILRLGN